MMCSANVKRILTIDQGNSSAKGVLWEGPEIIDTVRMEGSAIEDLLPLLERTPNFWKPCDVWSTGDCLC